MEEFIFDDEMNDVGAEIEAHCPKCHSTSHHIVSKYEDEVRRVQCNSCGHVHPYKKPRDDEEVETVAPVKKKAAKQKPTWDQVMAKSKKPPRPYGIGEYFKELEIVSHPKFGVGYVTDNIGSDKIEVTFQTDKRVLIHNRKGLNLPVLAMTTGDGAPTPKAKPGKKAAPPAAKVVEAPAKAGTSKAPPAKSAMAAKAAAPAKPAPRAAPAAKKPAPKPAAKKPAPKPVAKKPAPKPAAKKPALKPAAKKPAPPKKKR